MFKKETICQHAKAETITELREATLEHFQDGKQDNFNHDTVEKQYDNPRKTSFDNLFKITILCPPK